MPALLPYEMKAPAVNPAGVFLSLYIDNCRCGCYNLPVISKVFDIVNSIDINGGNYETIIFGIRCIIQGIF